MSGTFFDSPGAPGNVENPESGDETFKDQPEEIAGEEAPAVRPKIAQQAAKPDPRRVEAQVIEDEEEIEYYEEPEESEESEDFSTVLSDARLRLEQGRLYEMIMNHDIFQGVEVDPKAVKFVQKQIRNFAKEQMEIMLGMRQEAPQQAAFPMEAFPFNAMEVEVLKMLASTATKGASIQAEPFSGAQPPPARTSINPIGKGAGQTRPAPQPVKKVQARPLQAKPQAPVQRTRRQAEIEAILREEGVTMEEINEVFDPKREMLKREDLAKMTEEQIIERNRQVRNKRVDNPNAMPMPSNDQINAAMEARANEASRHPQMQMIMSAIDKQLRKE